VGVRELQAHERHGRRGGEKTVLQQLASGPKTYDELAAALGKARTTIQAHHIPILEKRGLVRRAGKRGAAWLWEAV
jgi:predicted transcriptional regulator